MTPPPGRGAGATDVVGAGQHPEGRDDHDDGEAEQDDGRVEQFVDGGPDERGRGTGGPENADDEQRGGDGFGEWETGPVDERGNGEEGATPAEQPQQGPDEEPEDQDEEQGCRHATGVGAAGAVATWVGELMRMRTSWKEIWACRSEDAARAVAGGCHHG